MVKANQTVVVATEKILRRSMKAKSPVGRLHFDLFRIDVTPLSPVVGSLKRALQTSRSGGIVRLEVPGRTPSRYVELTVIWPTSDSINSIRQMTEGRSGGFLDGMLLCCFQVRCSITWGTLLSSVKASLTPS